MKFTTTNYTPSIRLNSGGNTNQTTFTNDTAIWCRKRAG